MSWVSFSLWPPDTAYSHLSKMFFWENHAELLPCTGFYEKMYICIYFGIEILTIIIIEDQLSIFKE